MKVIKLLFVFLSFSFCLLETNELKQAIKKGSYDEVRSLIEKKVNINGMFPETHSIYEVNYLSPLLLALKMYVKSERQEVYNDIVKLLLISGADLNKEYTHNELYFNDPDPDFNDPNGNIREVYRYKVYDRASPNLKVLLESTTLLNENKFEDAFQNLKNNNLLKEYGLFMLLLFHKKLGLKSLNKMLSELAEKNAELDIIKKYQQELSLLDGYIPGNRKDLSLISGYSHKERLFQDKVRKMAYISSVLSGSRFKFDEKTNVKLTTLPLPFEVANKIASYV